MRFHFHNLACRICLANVIWETVWGLVNEYTFITFIPVVIELFGGRGL